MMGVLAFETNKAFRSATLSVALFLSVIVISMTTIVKPAQAAGTASSVFDRYLYRSLGCT